MSSLRISLAILAFLAFAFVKVLQTKDDNPFVNFKLWGPGTIEPPPPQSVWNQSDSEPLVIWDGDNGGDGYLGNETLVIGNRENATAEYEPALNRTVGDQFDNSTLNLTGSPLSNGIPPSRLRRTPSPFAFTEDYQDVVDDESIFDDFATPPPGPLDPNDVKFWDDDRIPNFYDDIFQTYDCKNRYLEPGSHPRFMVIGVHKGGSTALYNYMAKHGRIRPAVCKEIHYFDKDLEYVRGKGFYLRHFPDVSMWRSRVITGEGSPNYIRTPSVPLRVKGMFPETKFIITLRNPSARFVSHWVGKKDQHLTNLAYMTCEEAWNTSLAEYERCLASDTPRHCEVKLHENALVRGIYSSQIETWLKFFPAKQFLIIQAEAMFHNRTKTLEDVTRFLKLRPYTEAELMSLNSAQTGSSHHDEPLAKECDHLLERMDAFYANANQRLKELLAKRFPLYLQRFVEHWSGM